MSWPNVSIERPSFWRQPAAAMVCYWPNQGRTHMWPQRRAGHPRQKIHTRCKCPFERSSLWGRLPVSLLRWREDLLQESVHCYQLQAGRRKLSALDFYCLCSQNWNDVVNKHKDIRCREGVIQNALWENPLLQYSKHLNVNHITWYEIISSNHHLMRWSWSFKTKHTITKWTFLSK